MCVRPNKLDNGQEVACRECWQCVQTKVDDWVGRNIAECRTAKACHAITLTYGGGDHARAAWLTYSDVQKYFKLLRRRGFPCRYFAVGEYGKEKGRAHWHLIVYWLDRVPPHELGVRFDEYHWGRFDRQGKRIGTMGFSEWTVPGYGLETEVPAIRYVCKYVHKDLMDKEAQGFLSMSKKPPLGDLWFRMLAAKYVDAGLSPQDFFYSFPEVKRDGKPIKFCMHGKTRENFLVSFLDQWAAKHDDAPPRSEIVWDFLDKFRFCSVRRKWVPWSEGERRIDQLFRDRQRKDDAIITVRWLDPSSPEFLSNRRKDDGSSSEEDH